jgi:NDP-sugar pyrophosphorylase family protein
MAFTGGKVPPEVNPSSKTAELQMRLIEDLKKGPPQLFGFKFTGNWADDGTLPAILQGHFDILKELEAKGRNSCWPIDWHLVKSGYPKGIITMSDLTDVLSEITLTPPVFIDRGVRVLPGAKIGPYAVIGEGWKIGGEVERSVLFPMNKADRAIADMGELHRFCVNGNIVIKNSLIASGFEWAAVDENANPIDAKVIDGKVVVSNGLTNVISPIDI